VWYNNIVDGSLTTAYCASCTRTTVRVLSSTGAPRVGDGRRPAVILRQPKRSRSAFCPSTTVLLAAVNAVAALHTGVAQRLPRHSGCESVLEALFRRKPSQWFRGSWSVCPNHHSLFAVPETLASGGLAPQALGAQYARIEHTGACWLGCGTPHVAAGACVSRCATDRGILRCAQSSSSCRRRYSR